MPENTPKLTQDQKDAIQELEAAYSNAMGLGLTLGVEDSNERISPIVDTIRVVHVVDEETDLPTGFAVLFGSAWRRGTEFAWDDQDDVRWEDEDWGHGPDPCECTEDALCPKCFELLEPKAEETIDCDWCGGTVPVTGVYLAPNDATICRKCYDRIQPMQLEVT
jgi:hypothetical protein